MSLNVFFSPTTVQNPKTVCVLHRKSSHSTIWTSVHSHVEVCSVWFCCSISPGLCETLCRLILRTAGISLSLIDAVQNMMMMTMINVKPAAGELNKVDFRSSVFVC